MNYSEIAIAAILMAAILGASIVFLRRRGQKENEEPGEQKEPGPERYSVSRIAIAKRERPLKLNGWEIIFLVILLILALNVAFIQPLSYMRGEFYYMEGQLIASLMQRMTFMPLYWGILIATFIYIFGTWLRPTLVFDAVTYWYFGKPEVVDGVYKFRVWHRMHLKEYQVAAEFVTHSAMNYFIIGKPKKRGNGGIPDVEAIQSEQLEILHNNLAITERDEFWKRLQKEIKLNDSQVQSAKDLAKELMEAARGGGKDQ